MSDVELAKLHAAFESFSREVWRRFDRQDATLLEIRTDVKATNGNVIRHDEQIKTLQSAAVTAAKVVSGQVTPKDDDEATFRERVRFAFWGVGGGFGAAFALLKLIGKL